MRYKLKTSNDKNLIIEFSGKYESIILHQKNVLHTEFKLDRENFDNEKTTSLNQLYSSLRDYASEYNPDVTRKDVALLVYGFYAAYISAVLLLIFSAIYAFAFYICAFDMNQESYDFSIKNDPRYYIPAIILGFVFFTAVLAVLWTRIFKPQVISPVSRSLNKFAEKKEYSGSLASSPEAFLNVFNAKCNSTYEYLYSHCNSTAGVFNFLIEDIKEHFKGKKSDRLLRLISEDLEFAQSFLQLTLKNHIYRAVIDNENLLGTDKADFKYKFVAEMGDYIDITCDPLLPKQIEKIAQSDSEHSAILKEINDLIRNDRSVIPMGKLSLERELQQSNPYYIEKYTAEELKEAAMKLQFEAKTILKEKQISAQKDEKSEKTNKVSSFIKNVILERIKMPEKIKTA